MKKVTQLKNLKNKTVLVRVDFNVPLKGKKIVDDFKIKATLPTIQYLLKQKARVILISHLGRPFISKQDARNPLTLPPTLKLRRAGKKQKNSNNKLQEFSLKSVAVHLEKLLKRKVQFITDYNKVKGSKAKLILLENIRFDKREQSDNRKLKRQLAKELSELGDYFVFESFASAHRQEASVYYLPDYLPTYTGLRFIKEINDLKKVLTKRKGAIAIIGGAKIKTKIKLIRKLLNKVDYLLVGGGVANNFLKVLGYEIGKSIYEPTVLAECEDLLNKKILLPIDVVVVSQGKRVIKPASQVKKNDKILDIGPETIDYYKDIIKKAKLIIWNGPMGLFEKRGYETGSYAIALEIAASRATKVTGGGETLTIINILNIFKYLDLVSTGGGAMLKYLEDGNLPILDKLG